MNRETSEIVSPRVPAASNRDISEMSQSRVLAAYLGDIRFELVKMLRVPAFMIPTLLFPVMFFLLFGVLLGSARGNGQQAVMAFAGLGVFGAIAPGLFGFGVSLAFEREQGMLIFRQAIPMPSGSYLLARMAMAMLFVGVVSLLMLLLAVFLAHIPLTLSQCVTWWLINVFGVLPFCAIGLFVGSMVSGQAAPAIINLIYIPMAFLSGLWVPLQVLGSVVPALQKLATIWPSYHLLQLSLNALDQGSMGETSTHVYALAGFTLVFFTLAVRRLGGSGIRLFGSPGAAPGFPLRRAVTIGFFWLAVAFIVTGVLNGNAPRAATNTAATSKDATETGKDASAATGANDSGAPVGVAAPDRAVVADFDNGSANTSYGIGFAAHKDGDHCSTASQLDQEIVADGADHSHGALQIKGNVVGDVQYPFCGTAFLPNGSAGTDFDKQPLMDFSRKQTLSFFARGDGQNYTVVLLTPRQGPPAMFQFTPGTDWQEVRVPLNEFAADDMKRVRLIAFGTSKPGTFDFEIDNVRIE